MRTMNSTPLRVVSIGECTIDHYLDLQKEYVGGISLNFAVHSKRSGAENVSLITRVGKNDESKILQKLAAEKIDSSQVKTLNASSARQNITLTTTGERIFPEGGYDPGVLKTFQLSDAEIQFVQNHNLLASSMFQQLEPLFRQVMSISFDGWRVADFLDLTDYKKDIRIVEQFTEKLTIAFISGDHELVENIRPLSRSTNCLIVITLGADGSAALIKGEPIFQSSSTVAEIVDSTGCGDAFQAAFTVSYWREKNVQCALESGARQSNCTSTLRCNRLMFRTIFPKRNSIIGMIALPPLPGYPEFRDLDSVIERALGDLNTLQQGGIDGVCIENDYDQPHQLIVGPEIVAAFTIIAQEAAICECTGRPSSFVK